MAAQLRFAEAGVALEADAIDGVARAFLDEEIHLHFGIVRREDELSANPRVEKAFLLVKLSYGGDVVIQRVKIERAVAENEDVAFGVNFVLKPVLREGVRADECHLSHAD